MESELKRFTTEELQKELEKRHDRYFGRCKCGKWDLYMGCSRTWNKELHCYGCRRPIDECRC